MQKLRHTENSARTTEFLALERPWIFISTNQYFTQTDNIWNESTSDIQVYIQQWFNDEQGDKFM